MMKYIITLLLVFSTSILCSQENLDILWQGCYGGTNSDEAKGIVQAGNGYFIFGQAESNDGDISFSHGLGEAWLIKTDSENNLLWERCYGGSQQDLAEYIIKTDENSFYLISNTISSDGDISNDPYPDSWDIWVTKIDSSGNIIWDKIIGGNMVDVAYYGIESGDGIIFIGATESWDGDISNYFGYIDIWFAALDSEGNLLWDFTIGGSNGELAYSIIKTSDGGFLVSGSTWSNDGNINCEPHSELASDVIIAKLDLQHNIEWVQCYGGTWGESAFDVIEVATGYVFTAFSYSNDGDVSGHHGIAGPPSEDGTADIWVVKLDFDGNIIWQNSIGGSESEVSRYITSTEDGGFIIIGNTKSHDGDVVGNHSIGINDDIWMVKLNSDGEIEWQRCIGGIGDEEVEKGILKFSDYHYAIAGETGVMDGDVLCDPWGPDMFPDYWAFEIKDTTTNISIESYSDNLINIFPNPTQDYLNIEYSNTTAFNQLQLKIFDTNGNLKLSQPVITGQLVSKIEVNNWSSGLYGIFLFSDEKLVGKTKIIIK